MNHPVEHRQPHEAASKSAYTASEPAHLAPCVIAFLGLWVLCGVINTFTVNLGSTQDTSRARISIDSALDPIR